MSPGVRTDPSRRRFVVMGDGPLPYRLVLALTTRYEGDVVVITPDPDAKYSRKMARLPHVVDVVHAARPGERTFREKVRLAEADALALVSDDDAGNLEAALVAREVTPGIRLVIRVFDNWLRRGIAPHLDNCEVLSDAKLAAPALVATALGEPSRLNLRGLDLVAGHPRAVQDGVLFPLFGVRDVDGEPSVRALPDYPPDAGRPATPTLVLATRDPDPPTSDRRVRRIVGVVLRGIGPSLLISLAVLTVLIAAGATVLALDPQTGWATALYSALLFGLGGADPDDKATERVHAVQVALTIVSVAVIPAVTAGVVDSIVRARLETAVGGPVLPVTDHVVVVGLGELGTRVLRELHDRGIEVVAVDHARDARGVGVARDLHVPVVVGDGRRLTTLDQARVGHARAVLALTGDDLVNIASAASARQLLPNPVEEPGNFRGRVVMRLFEDDFARRMERFIPASRSRSATFHAAPAFAAAMLGPWVIDAVHYGDRVLLVAELPVRQGSEAVGQPLRALHRLSYVRVLGLRRNPPRHDGEQDLDAPLLPADDDHEMAPGDRLVVVSTRQGLERLQEMTAPPSLRL
ncbi:NAD-binding protein [Antribacter gilvus]|uniref:NAD-binding protein n=1 Tax=Antribacter gilvus TaxID=2304675 RepID=UPI0013DEAD72|nr:NAD-binding protein [Antribacter gilvus]